MTTRPKWLLVAGLAWAGLDTSISISLAQPPDEVEVLARGPIHEAYATTTEQPAASPVVGKRPPDPVEELPPDQKPEGENVQFIPGYWHYDDDRSDYVWISGFWRATPPGRMWVPGSWREAPGGWQWAAGFWQEATQQIVQQQIQYLPPPPQPLEVAPATPAPSTTSFYVPGSWVYRERYVWRPGVWIDYRPGWVWTPAHYRWTPCGHVFVDGFWDYPLAGRGMLFAPVYFPPRVLRPSYVYTPTYVVREPTLYGSLFVRAGYGSYYFGDYFEARYATSGFNAWVGTGGSGFAIGIGVNSRPRYDPLWDYYRLAYRNDPTWATNVTAVYTGRYNGTVARPPRTLVQQNVVVNNVVNNTTVVNNNTTIINNNQMVLTSLQNMQKTDKTVVLKPVSKDQQVTEQKQARELKEVSAQRTRLEKSLVDRGQVTTKTTDPVRAIKLDVSKQAVARAQMSTDEKKAPPPPVTKLPPVTAAKVDAKPVTPKVDPLKPKVDPPKGTPQKFDPVKPKVDPVKPKVDPINPKVDPPKGTPPKVDPVKPKVDPPKVDPNKPKVDPPKVDPNKPKVDPPRGRPPVVPKGNPPVVGPPKVDPPKADPPKPDPPKPGGGVQMGARQRFEPRPVMASQQAKPVTVAPMAKPVAVATAPTTQAKPVAPAPKAKPVGPTQPDDKDKKSEPKKMS